MLRISKKGWAKGLLSTTTRGVLAEAKADAGIAEDPDAARWDDAPEPRLGLDTVNAVAALVRARLLELPPRQSSGRPSQPLFTVGVLVSAADPGPTERSLDEDVDARLCPERSRMVGVFGF